MKKTVAIAIALIILLSINTLAEGLLPGIADAFDVYMPSLSKMLKRYPDGETILEDGSNEQVYYNVTEEDFERFSEYLERYGCGLKDYFVVDGVMFSVVEYMGKAFHFEYDLASSIAKAKYPNGTLAEELNPLEIAVIGDIVTFGYYEQDNNLDNGAEPIEWVVISKNHLQCELLSLYALDCQVFHPTLADQLSWKKSSLRKWLNKDFYSTAFSADEQYLIKEKDIPGVAAEDEKYYDKDKHYKYYEDPTADKVYIQSVTEAATLVKKISHHRMAEGTPYAIANGAQANSGTRNDGKTSSSWVMYWLRTPDNYQISSEDYSYKRCFVRANGQIMGTGLNGFNDSFVSADKDFVAVRPVITVEIKK